MDSFGGDSIAGGRPLRPVPRRFDEQPIPGSRSPACECPVSAIWRQWSGVFQAPPEADLHGTVEPGASKTASRRLVAFGNLPRQSNGTSGNGRAEQSGSLHTRQLRSRTIWSYRGGTVLQLVQYEFSPRALFDESISRTVLRREQFLWRWCKRHIQRSAAIGPASVKPQLHLRGEWYVVALP